MSYTRGFRSKRVLDIARTWTLGSTPEQTIRKWQSSGTTRVGNDGGYRSSAFGGRTSGWRTNGGRSSDGPTTGGRSSWAGRNRYGYDDVPTEKRDPPYGHYDGDHIYGVSSVLMAIRSGKRNISELLIQEGMDLTNKKDQSQAHDILKTAKSMNIPIREFSKHDLNMLTENRPHQGFVLRAAPLNFIKKDALPPSPDFKCVLALDEVWDPQNFGALLRTCLFLGVDEVVVCAKNSAPLSPTVSKASAGALEVMDIASTSNMMRFLDKSQENGWQIVGTSLGDEAVDLNSLPLNAPTILVLGNEGHGVRTNILRRCTHLVKIAGSNSLGDSAVDSLNVSVTGGILLHHILSAKK